MACIVCGSDCEAWALLVLRFLWRQEPSASRLVGCARPHALCSRPQTFAHPSTRLIASTPEAVSLMPSPCHLYPIPRPPCPKSHMQHGGHHSRAMPTPRSSGLRTLAGRPFARSSTALCHVFTPPPLPHVLRSPARLAFASLSSPLDQPSTRRSDSHASN